MSHWRLVLESRSACRSQMRWTQQEDKNKTLEVGQV
jgi:hypothetical protein